MKILIDNGHGVDTAGKRSPDSSLLEYKWAREIAQRVSRLLSLKGCDTVLITPEETDTSLTKRVERVNAWCDKVGANNCALVSIHVNAAGNSGWSEARGWLCIVDDAASELAKALACNLHDEIEGRGITTRHYKSGQKWYTYGQAIGTQGSRLAILRKTKCPAVLTENLFMTNREDVTYLNSEAGKQAITEAHVNAIVNYLATLKG